jgi:hypothetical protein
MIRLFYVVGVSVLATVAFGGQPATPATLPEALRVHARDEKFQLVTSIRGLPLGVRDALQALFGGGSLDIAEPGAAFQSTGVVDPKLPTRRLIAAACSIDHCLVYYERGGTARSWHVAVFHWTPAATRFDWGGMAPRGLESIDDVRRAVLSGAIKAPAGFW